MLDAYKCTDEKAADMSSIYSVISRLTHSLGVKTIAPPILVPYYYGKEKADDGISAFVLLKGGHFTIHTFPERECYFVDMLYDGFFNPEKFQQILSKELPFGVFKIASIDRRFDVISQQKDLRIDECKDFGPHYLIKGENEIELNIDKIYHFLDRLPPKVNMTPIMRPYVMTDALKKPTYISGITMIAESHIALHYHIETKTFFADVFSCSFVDAAKVQKEIEKELGVKCENALISRGSKHTHRLPSREEFTSRYDNWRENI